MSSICSPYYRLQNLSEELGMNIHVKRDDLLPDFMGGNKVRKNKAIFDSFEIRPEVIITNGGAESNHARVCALMAAQQGIKCHLVLHGEPQASGYLNGNQFFIEATKSEVTYVCPTKISETINNLVQSYKDLSLIVEVIPGGAHCIQGAKAYMDAVDELPEEPEFIFLASGTGATHAGIQAGVVARGWNTKVIGISVARLNPRGKEAVEEVYYPLLEHFLGLTKRDSPDIEFIDSYVNGGYGKWDMPLLNQIQYEIIRNGIPLDPVYSGKAFIGMLDYIKKNVKEGSNIVFWHTGGLLNLQSSKGD